MVKKEQKEIEIDLKNLRPGEENIAKAALEVLKESAGWKIICEVLRANIEATESIILDGDQDMDKFELQMWRDRRYYQKKLIETPQMIINKLSPTTTKNEIKLDPYS